MGGGGGGPGGGMGGGGGPGGGFGGGGPGGGRGGSGTWDTTDWWSAIPQDALRRIGETEQNQPYFAIWGYDGWHRDQLVLRASPNASDAGVPTKEDLTTKTPQMMTTSITDESPMAEFRTRGDMREVIVQSPGGGYHVVVGKSLDPVQRELVVWRWELWGAGAAVMAIGLCGGWLLSVRATRPIRTISDTAQAISATDLSRRIPVEETSSELGVLATTLNETFERLQTSFERQVRFTADASHELRTPLSVIHSQTELSLSRERSAPEYKQSLETCLRAAKRMKSLVESLLVLARADAGKLVLNVEKFDAAAAAAECVAMVEPRAQERRVTVALNAQPAEMEGDRTRVMQLVTNLLMNAIQYNHEGGKATVGIAGHDGEVEIRVQDTGVGMTEEEQRHVFERFFRADPARSRDVGGSGLGLAICRSVAEAHGGRITFHSEFEKGTEFVVRLPVTYVPGGKAK